MGGPRRDNELGEREKCPVRTGYRRRHNFVGSTTVLLMVR
jgi:hypothetical protein